MKGVNVVMPGDAVYWLLCLIAVTNTPDCAKIRFQEAGIVLMPTGDVKGARNHDWGYPGGNDERDRTPD